MRQNKTISGLQKLLMTAGALAGGLFGSGCDGGGSGTTPTPVPDPEYPTENMILYQEDGNIKSLSESGVITTLAVGQNPVINPNGTPWVVYDNGGNLYEMLWDGSRQRKIATGYTNAAISKDGLTIIAEKFPDLYKINRTTGSAVKFSDGALTQRPNIANEDLYIQYEGGGSTKAYKTSLWNFNPQKITSGDIITNPEFFPCETSYGTAIYGRNGPIFCEFDLTENVLEDKVTEQPSNLTTYNNGSDDNILYDATNGTDRDIKEYNINTGITTTLIGGPGDQTNPTIILGR